MIQILGPILGKFIVMKYIVIKQIFSMFVELYIKIYKFNFNNSNKLQNCQSCQNQF